MPAAQPLGNLWSATQWTADQKPHCFADESSSRCVGPRPQKCETLRLQGDFEGGSPWLCFGGGPECPSQLFLKFHPSCHGGCVVRHRARTQYLTPGAAKSMNSMDFHVFTCISMVFLSPRVGPGGPFFFIRLRRVHERTDPGASIRPRSPNGCRWATWA